KQFAESLPDYAKDIRLNLGSILSDQLIGEERKLSLLLACAHGSGYRPLVAAAEAEIERRLSDSQANAARGAAAVMAMNNVYYRFVHLTSNPEYGKLPARLRMNFIGSHGIAKEEFELMSLAVSAMNGCGMCIDSHERVLLEHGAKPDVIQSAVRIAAVMKAIATVHATL
ncbi:MAG: carboxymuconolactone decarboxylase family protein, partial [Sphingomicrobium sp.]